MLTIHDYEKVFTPGAPVSSRKFLVGRDDELYEIRRNIRRPGLHPIITGNRGVGKTSLINQAVHNMKGWRHVRVNCTGQSDFDSLARGILKRLDIETYYSESIIGTEKVFEGKLQFGVGIGGRKVNKESKKKIELGSRYIDPGTLFDILHDYEGKIIIILDEYDRLPRGPKSPRSTITDFIKSLSDQNENIPHKVVIIGVSKSAEQLLGQHESIYRSVREIYLSLDYSARIDGKCPNYMI